MKASLEPKEQQIENLKEQLLDLEKVFNQQLTALDNLEKDVKKKEDKIKEMQ
jgi:chromosome segregation ATPase